MGQKKNMAQKASVLSPFKRTILDKFHLAWIFLVLVGPKRDESKRGWRYLWNNEERSQDFQRL
jgi:hypothetical protein